MSWSVIILTLLIYPLFGVAIYVVRHKLYRLKNVNAVILTPTLISFMLGIVFLVYALASG